LMRTRWAFDQFPFITKEHIEVAHVPMGGIGFPSAFHAAGSGVDAHAIAKFILPAKTHFFQRSSFRLRSDQFRVTCAMCLAEGVSASDEGNGFFIVHSHAGEGLTHIKS